MKFMKKYLRINYIIVILFAAFVGIFMLYMNIKSEKLRLASSDYSEGWTLDGDVIDIDSFSSIKKSSSIYKKLPEKINTGDALCFISANSYFEVCIGDELIYSYKQQPNITGNGYGVAYHYINLLPYQAGKTVRFDILSAFRSGRGGRIRMISIENPRQYLTRLAKSQILPFVISSCISVIGVVIFIFCILFDNKKYAVNTMALAAAAISIGLWMAADTNFLRLVTDAVTFSRNTTYICMYLSTVPISIFLYSTTRQRNKTYLTAAGGLTAVYYAVILITRFGLGIDMASANMITAYFVYIFLLSLILGTMIIKDYKYCKAKGIVRDKEYFIVGIISMAICFILDISIYLSGVRSVSGYSTFTRIGFFAFFFSMTMELARMWSNEYASLWRYGFVDELTGLGNRRAYMRYENTIKGIYPYGYVMCDINSLKETNDTYGHGQGDILIKTIANRLKQVFGPHNTFRVGGDEFVAYSFEPTVEEFNAKVESARSLMSGKRCSASIGHAYASVPDTSREKIKKEAETVMYDAKEHYYISNNIDRRR